MKSTATLSKLCKVVFSGILAVALVTASFLPVSALSDGAYVLSRTTSYTNPETGETVDGGTNIALGDSMADSIVEDQVLVEQVGGKTYVTLGLGLMSNISSVRIQVQSADGSYHDAAITQTGSCTRIGDTCNHYRFEVESLDLLISPIIFVDPMGRDVQFFVKLDAASAQAGTGNFVSEMIPSADPQPQTSAPAAAEQTPAASAPEVEDTPQNVSETTSTAEETSQASTLSEAENTSQSTSTLSDSSLSSGLTAADSSVDGGMIAVILVIAVVVVAGGVVLTVVLVKKKRGRR